MLRTIQHQFQRLLGHANRFTAGSLQLSSRSIPYSIRKSQRARRARIRVSDKGIEVILPLRVAYKEAAGFLQHHATWIERQLVKLERIDSRRREHQREHPDAIMFHGTPIRVAIIRDAAARRRGTVEIHADGIKVTVPGPGTPDPRRLLENALRQTARQEIKARLAVRSREMNCSFERVFISNQRTRWGSCSRLKNLSFNWKLIQAPPEVLDYVVVHELAHLIEMNHSPRFWKIVRTHCPGFVESKTWLREHECLLGLHQTTNEDATT